MFTKLDEDDSDEVSQEELKEFFKKNCLWSLRRGKKRHWIRSRLINHTQKYGVIHKYQSIDMTCIVIYLGVNHE